MKENYIYETPVYCECDKVWRVLNLNNSNLYSNSFNTMREALNSIESSEKLGVVKKISMSELREKIIN